MIVVSRNLLIVISLSLVFVTISFFTYVSQISRWVGKIMHDEEYERKQYPNSLC